MQAHPVDHHVGRGYRKLAVDPGFVVGSHPVGKIRERIAFSIHGGFTGVGAIDGEGLVDHHILGVSARGEGQRMPLTGGSYGFSQTAVAHTQVFVGDRVHIRLQGRFQRRRGSTGVTGCISRAGCQAVVAIRQFVRCKDKAVALGSGEAKAGGTVEYLHGAPGLGAYCQGQITGNVVTRHTGIVYQFQGRCVGRLGVQLKSDFFCRTDVSSGIGRRDSQIVGTIGNFRIESENTRSLFCCRPQRFGAGDNRYHTSRLSVNGKCVIVTDAVTVNAAVHGQRECWCRR